MIPCELGELPLPEKIRPGIAHVHNVCLAAVRIGAHARGAHALVLFILGGVVPDALVHHLKAIKKASSLPGAGSPGWACQ